MSIKLKRQDSISVTPTPPTALEYGEPAISNDCTLYVGNGENQTAPVNVLKFDNKSSSEFATSLQGQKADTALQSTSNVDNNVSTFTHATSLVTLVSGEKLSVIFGKISKAITDLISHIGNKLNPHSVTAAQVGAAPINHASTDATYGVGNATNYGHLKLSDSTSAYNDVNGHTAATPAAVRNAYNLAAAALPKAGGTMTDWIHWNKQTKGLQWVTDDGTIFQLRPYSAGNSYQFVTQKTNGVVLGSWNVDNQGVVQVNGFNSWQLQCISAQGTPYPSNMLYSQWDGSYFKLKSSTREGTDVQLVRVDLADTSLVSYSSKDANNDTVYKLYKYGGAMHIWNATENHEDYIGVAKGADGASSGNFVLPNGAKIENWSNQALFLWSSGEQAYRIMLGVRDDIWTLCPDVNNNVYLGTASARWGKLFCVNAPDVSSDGRLKENIVELDEKYAQFILGLQSCRYNLITDKTGKVHMGFVAQDVEALMTKLGLDALSYGIINKNQKYNEVQVVEEYWDEELDDISQRIKSDSAPTDGEYEYSLCYEEFISPIVATVQKQQKEIDELKDSYSLLEARIAKLEGNK